MNQEELIQRLSELESFIAAPEQAESKRYFDNPFEFSDNFHVGNEALNEFIAAENEIRNI